MSEAAAAKVTIGQHLPWVYPTLDYLDRLTALIPEDMLDWRPTDPNGHFMLSLSEIVRHCIDERLEFARQLAGSEDKDGHYALWYYTDDSNEDSEEDTGWQFKPHGGRQALLEALRRSREELQPWLDLPVDKLQEPTDGTRAVFQKYLAKMKAKGDDTAAMEARGPASINRVLFSLCVHEAGHRATLQTLLRLNGVDARGDE